MNFIKINSRGFTHHLIAVVVILVVAVGGTAYLVATHADSCTPTSGSSTSGSSVSCPTSTPTSTVALSARCSVTGIPIAPTYNEILRPVVSITSTGGPEFVPVINYTYAPNTKVSGQGGAGTATLPALNTSQTEKYNLPAINTPYASHSSQAIYTVTSAGIPAYTCQESYNLPINPSQ